MLEVGQVEVGQDSFDWRSTRYFAKRSKNGQINKLTKRLVYFPIFYESKNNESHKF